MRYSHRVCLFKVRFASYLLLDPFLFIHNLIVLFSIIFFFRTFRFLGFNILSAYQRAKFSAVKILSRSDEDYAAVIKDPIKFKTINQSNNKLTTVSQSIPVPEICSDLNCSDSKTQDNSSQSQS